MTYASPPPPPPPPSTDRLASIKTYVLVAWIFSIIIMVIWLLVGIFFIIGYISVVATASSFGFYGDYVAGAAIFGLIEGVIFLIFMIPAFLVFMRVRRLHSAANAGDIAALKANSSVGWGIIALIFVGVITGIMLLIADGPIKQL